LIAETFSALVRGDVDLPPRSARKKSDKIFSRRARIASGDDAAGANRGQRESNRSRRIAAEAQRIHPDRTPRRSAH
jgi:hypothetical protein